jgi:hypothetical protein
MDQASFLNLVLAILITVGFWAAVYWAVKKWAEKQNAEVGKTMWNVIILIIGLSVVARACDPRSDNMSVSDYQKQYRDGEVFDHP